MIRLRAVLLLCVGVGCRLAAVEPVAALLIGADEAALRPVLAKITDVQSTTHGAWISSTGRIAGKNVAVTQGEGDPLNAVAATTLAIRLYAPKLIIVFGSARAHDPELRGGDIVVSESFAAFDGIFSNRAELEAGSHPTTWEKLPHSLLAADEKEILTPVFPADLAAKETALTLKTARGRVLTGVLGSANQINREADRVAWLRANWGTRTEDGVSAHVAGCARLFGVPIVGVCVVDAPPVGAAEFVLRLVEALK